MPAVTVTSAVPVFDGSAAEVAVTIAAPAVIARTSPVEETTATPGALLVTETTNGVPPALGTGSAGTLTVKVRPAGEIT